MSNADLIQPGFYGKLPAAGDFVTRRLPHDFVRAWDRWLAEHIVSLIGSDDWPASIALRFVSGGGAFGPAAGIVVASRDRVGRRFPLLIAAPLPSTSAELANRADDWFVALEGAAAAAQDGLSPDDLDALLCTLPLQPDTEPGDPVEAITVWTAHSDLYDLNPDSPLPVLHRVLAYHLEAS